MSQVLHLYRLQQLDLQIDQARQRLKAIEAQLAANPALRLAQANAQAATSALDSAQHALREAENAVQGQRIKIELNQNALYSGKRTPKELVDLQAEGKSLTKHLNTLEERQLEAIIEMESRDADYQQAAGALRDAEAQAIQSNAALAGERSTLQRDLERWASERGAVLGSIQPALVQRYEQLRKARKGIAIARIDEDGCGACGAELTPAERQSARSASQILACPSCGRILYAG